MWGKTVESRVVSNPSKNEVVEYRQHVSQVDVPEKRVDFFLRRFPSAP